MSLLTLSDPCRGGEGGQKTISKRCFTVTANQNTVDPSAIASTAGRPNFAWREKIVATATAVIIEEEEEIFAGGRERIDRTSRRRMDVRTEEGRFK